MRNLTLKQHFDGYRQLIQRSQRAELHGLQILARDEACCELLLLEGNEDVVDN